MIEVGIKDIIDIVLVALLLFYIYKLMRESSSANIFGGVLIFVLVWIFVSKVFEMRLLGGIFDTLINVGSLALIILFKRKYDNSFPPSARSAPHGCSTGCTAIARATSIARTSCPSSWPV